jgi:hypothetical protein
VPASIVATFLANGIPFRTVLGIELIAVRQLFSGAGIVPERGGGMTRAPGACRSEGTCVATVFA